MSAAVLATGCQAVVPSPSSGTPSASALPPTTAPESRPPPVVDLTGTGYAPEAGGDGGTVVVGALREAWQFNPYYLGGGSEPLVAGALWATLVRVTHDQRYLPELATTVPTVDNGGVATPGEDGEAMTVSWTLRDGLKWSDGQPLTCGDFRYAWEWVRDTANFGVATAGFEDLDDVECQSEADMVWHFDSVYSGYLTLMPAPLPRHHLASIPMDQQTQGAGFRLDELARLPVSGPFRFASVSPGVGVDLVRNPNYAAVGTGRPAHLEALVFRWYADAGALVGAFRAGQVGVATGLGADDLPGLADVAAQVVTSPSLSYEALRPNWSAEACSTGLAVRDRGSGCPAADPAIRHAVALAMDREAIVRQVVGLESPVPSTNVPPEAWFHTSQAPIGRDPAAARRMLDDAGWQDRDGDGIREKDGLEARVEICTTTRRDRRETLALLEPALRDVGIEAISREVEPKRLSEGVEEAAPRTVCAVRRGNFDFVLHSQPISIEPRDWYVRYHSSQFEPDGENDARVSDSGIDVALETARATASAAVARDAMGEFQKLYVEQVVDVPLWFGTTTDLRSASLGNVVGSAAIGGLAWNVADWYVRS